MTTISAQVRTCRVSKRCDRCGAWIHQTDDYLRTYGYAQPGDPRYVLRFHIGCGMAFEQEPKVMAALEAHKHCSKHGEKDRIECWNCDGDGFSHHDCGEDCCCCLDPEEKNVLCSECHGAGGWWICRICHPGQDEEDRQG